jgi:hypothetical protein
MLNARGAVLALVPSLAFPACVGASPALIRRVDELRVEQQQRQAELDRIEQEIAAARTEQQRQQCRAISAQLLSEVAIQRAQCLATRSDYAQCVAENEANKSKSGMVGCLVGLGAAVVTGGAAAPLTLTGCGGGLLVGDGNAKECGPSPVCTPDPTVLGATVLSAHGLTSWPQCP